MGECHMRTNVNVGKPIKPQSVTQVGQRMVEVNYGKLGKMHVFLDKLSPRLKSMMA